MYSFELINVLILWKMECGHTFYIRYDEKQFIVDHVNLNRYSYVELVSDIYGWVLSDIPTNVSCMFIVRCRIPSTNQHLELKTNNDILERFNIYRGRVGRYLEVVDVQMVTALAKAKPLK